MAGVQKFDCTVETDERSRAMEALQLFTSVLIAQRRQFVLETETKADGSFSLTITGSGKPLSGPVSYAGDDPAYDPFVIKENLEALDWGVGADEIDEPAPVPAKSAKKPASKVQAQPE